MIPIVDPKVQSGLLAWVFFVSLVLGFFFTRRVIRRLAPKDERVHRKTISWALGNQFLRNDLCAALISLLGCAATIIHLVVLAQRHN